MTQTARGRRAPRPAPRPRQTPQRAPQQVPRETRRNRRPLLFLLMVGGALAIMVGFLAVHAQGDPSSGKAPPQRTVVDVVPTPAKTPAPPPQPTPAPYVPQVISEPGTPYVAPPPKPTVHVTRVVTLALPMTSALMCLPTQTQPFLIRSTIYVTNPVGGVVTFHWKSSDGFISVPEKVTFKRGQTSAVVSDVWTLGAGNADGLARWEEAVVTSPRTLTSNRASFIYTCPAIITDLKVDAVRTAMNCATGTWGYDVTATVTIFAPAGGSVTYHWQHTNGTGTYTEAQTIHVPRGLIEVYAIAHWHIGNGVTDPALPEGVEMVSSTGQVLTTPVVERTGPGNGSGSPAAAPVASPSPTATTCPTPTPTPPTPVTVNGITLTNATTSVGPNPVYNCILGGDQQFSFSGQVAVTATESGILTYHWLRPDGSVGPDLTVPVNAGDTAVTIPADDPWTQAANPTTGQYGEAFVITAITTTDPGTNQPVTTTLTAPFAATYAAYSVLCPTQPTPTPTDVTPTPTDTTPTPTPTDVATPDTTLP